MASIAKILPHLEKGDRSPDSSDNGFDSFGCGSASSPERNNSDQSDHQSRIIQSESDSGRVSSPDDVIENQKSNNFRPWEDESKSKSESRVPGLF